MSKVAILTDTNSGIMRDDAAKLGISVIPMPFYINGDLYYEDVNLTENDFYEKQGQGADISTSMPVVGDVIDTWEGLLKEYDQVVYIPMSSGLSSSCQTAKMLAEEDYEGRVFVVDNHRISVTQKQSVMNAIHLAEEGKDGARIKKILEEDGHNSSIYITVNTLEYLKKGGRLTPAVAMIGTLLRIKPVLQIQGEKLDTYSRARTMKQAKQIMMDAIVHDMKERFHDEEGKNMDIAMAYTHNKEAADEFKKEVEERFPNHNIIMDPLPLSIACHIGPGSLAVTCTKRLDA